MEATGDGKPIPDRFKPGSKRVRVCIAGEKGSRCAVGRSMANWPDREAACHLETPDEDDPYARHRRRVSSNVFRPESESDKLSPNPRRDKDGASVGNQAGEPVEGATVDEGHGFAAVGGDPDLEPNAA